MKANPFTTQMNAMPRELNTYFTHFLKYFADKFARFKILHYLCTRLIDKMMAG